MLTCMQMETFKKISQYTDWYIIVYKPDISQTYSVILSKLQYMIIELKS